MRKEEREREKVGGGSEGGREEIWRIDKEISAGSKGEKKKESLTTATPEVFTAATAITFVFKPLAAVDETPLCTVDTHTEQESQEEYAGLN